MLGWALVLTSVKKLFPVTNNFTSTNDNDENERDDRFLKLYNFILIPNGNANGNIASANQYNALSETSSLTSSEEEASDREEIFQLDF